MARPVVKPGVDLIKQFEGLHDGDKSTAILEPQRDPIGIWTIGWGSIYDLAGRRVTRNTAPITRDMAEMLLRREIRQKAVGVNKLTDVWLPDLSFAALVSFAYNLGIGAYRASTLRQRINAGDWSDVPHQFSRWNKAGGKVFNGLVRRRAAESEMFMRGLLKDGYIIEKEGVYNRPSTVTGAKRGLGSIILEVVGL